MTHLRTLVTCAFCFGLGSLVMTIISLTAEKPDNVAFGLAAMVLLLGAFWASAKAADLDDGPGGSGAHV